MQTETGGEEINLGKLGGPKSRLRDLPTADKILHAQKKSSNAGGEGINPGKLGGPKSRLRDLPTAGAQV